MQRHHARHALFTIMIAAAAIAGCTEAPPGPPAFYVPTTSMHQPRVPENETTIATAAYTPLSFQVLPGADDYAFFYGRGEKAIYTALPLTEISAFSVYTYDSHRISGPNESGYRYTYLVREGVFAP